MLEVEQKFSLANRNIAELEDRLVRIGFTKSADVEMTDWYFDVKSFDLVRKDCWLRYREKAGCAGQFELKRGQKGHRETGGSTTIYEEIEGSEAVELALSMLSETSRGGEAPPTEYEGHAVPTFPRSDAPFIPFARIVTKRSSWKAVDPKKQVLSDTFVVDLDTTEDGYAVGEVEAVVESASQVDEARQEIGKFVSELYDADDASDGPPMGKLEVYLQRKRPDLYEVARSMGVVS